MVWYKAMLYVELHVNCLLQYVAVKLIYYTTHTYVLQTLWSKSS